MPFNQLTAAEAERLDVMQEECAEVIAAIAKIKRHGYESYHPRLDNPQDRCRPTNRDDLARELGDVYALMDMLVQLGDVDGNAVEHARNQKHARMAPYLHHHERKADGSWRAGW